LTAYCAATIPARRWPKGPPERDGGRSLRALGLTEREADVLGWIAQGKTDAETGMVLGISPRTVAKHLEHIFDKLGVETRTAAVVRAVETARSDGHSHSASASSARAVAAVPESMPSLR
jgi:DNA-binding CsgD family transcriptional regulator